MSATDPLRAGDSGCRSGRLQGTKAPPHGWSRRGHDTEGCDPSMPDQPIPIGLCECGCGAQVRAGRRFVKGHNAKSQSPEYIVDAESGCWVWQRCLTFGYGRKRVKGVDWRAHRWYYEQAHGPIPAGLVIDHLCRNRACVNPAHMEPVTNRENILRGVSPHALNARKTHCKRDHEYTPENTYLTPAGLRQCRECDRQKNREWKARSGYNEKRRAA